MKFSKHTSISYTPFRLFFFLTVPKDIKLKYVCFGHAIFFLSGRKNSFGWIKRKKNHLNILQ